MLEEIKRAIQSNINTLGDPEESALLQEIFNESPDYVDGFHSGLKLAMTIIENFEAQYNNKD